MATGVNLQRRLKALHHLDMLWPPSQIQQREGPIERPDNAADAVTDPGWAHTFGV